MPEIPRLLMVTPILPALSGNGLAMRAAMTLRALARHYRVSLLIVPLYSSPADRRLPQELSGLCETVQFSRGNLAHQLAEPARTGQLAGSFDVVHVFRLVSLSFAQPWIETAGETHLDLDDIESVSRPRIALLHREHGQVRQALAEEAAARAALSLEIEALTTFNRVYVGSAADVDNLPFCGSAQVRILPNVIELPASPISPPDRGRPFTFLFVGNLGYFPNIEGLVHFSTTVLPLLRQSASPPFQVQVVGNSASAALKKQLNAPEVDVVGTVPEVAPWYAGAGAVIVPIRAGGGTRIKVLEAFSYQRPVVSSSLGVEGIDAQDGVHVLIADDPEAFAANCRRLMEHASMREQLSAHAYKLVASSHTLDAMIKAVAPDSSRLQPR